MKAVKVQFKKLGKKYYFGCSGFDLKILDKVVVETVRGVELGVVVSEVFDLENKDLNSELKDIVRIATEEDIKNHQANTEDQDQIIQQAKHLSKQHKLDIKVLSADYTLDRGKLIIHFESEDRVDFRDLVKDLADRYKTRIELRQVGSRDGAKAFGGIGPCGLIVCCKTFLTEFENVTVKMAKNQNLSLNPLKISGSCGKLLCCINYENELYKDLRKVAPDIGDIVQTENGNAKVLNCDVLNRNVKVRYLNDDRYAFLKFDEIKLIPKVVKE